LLGLKPNKAGGFVDEFDMVVKLFIYFILFYFFVFVLL